MISDELLQKLNFTHNRHGYVSILQDKEGVSFGALIQENDMLINKFSDTPHYEYTLTLSGLSYGSNVSVHIIYNDSDMKRAMLRFKAKTNVHNRFLAKFVGIIASVLFVSFILKILS